MKKLKESYSHEESVDILSDLESNILANGGSEDDAVSDRMTNNAIDEFD